MGKPEKMSYYRYEVG